MVPGRGACREDKHNEAPDGSERGQKGSGRASRRASTRLPPCCIGEFSRRASRVGNLPSDEKKVVYPTVVLRFFQQKSNFGLDARHGTFILINVILRAGGSYFIGHLNKGHDISNVI